MNNSDTPIRVLVVEDTATMRLLLSHSIEADPRLSVAGSVESGEAALAFLAAHDADVILMDIHLPGMNGFQTTRRIMETKPLPIVICSAVSDPNDVATTFEAMDAGALAVLEKPDGPAHARYEETMRHLLETLKLMSEVKVIRRWSRPRAGPVMATPGAIRVGPVPVAPRVGEKPRIVAIGTSTGGPPVLRTILTELPEDFPVPVVVVQHIARDFLHGLVEWLAQSCAVPIHVAVHGERPLPGHVYFAPDGFHLGVSARGQFVLSDRMPADVQCPSVSHLFGSLIPAYGANAIGVLLTGMGKDGAQELADMRRCGATTIAQDKATSVVHGMPGEAIRLDGAMHVLPAHEIAAALKRMVFPA